jgi:transposase
VEATAEELEWFFATVLPHMNERQRRVVAGATALMIGHGGKARVAEASGLSRNTVIRATGEISAGLEVTDRQRGPGGGDKPAIDKQPGLLEALDELVHPDTRGNPMSFVRWTSKSTYELADELTRQGFQVSAELVRRLLHQMGYSLQAPSKQKEGTDHPDRDSQFKYLNATIAGFAETGEPAVSVDTKKKELVGEYHNNGREWQPKGEPVEVLDHDFVNPEMGKAVPYGVYDLSNDEGWVSVGDNADTAAFAVESIRRWWQHMGAERFPAAKRLLITADAGGSNGYRIRAFKVELAKLAAETGLEITVCHYPPGTSKWNKIEHRMFSFISMNWRGRPLTSYRTIVELISTTTTRKGLRVRAERDTTGYRTQVRISDTELAAVPLRRHEFHGDWNYTIDAT